MGQDLSTNHLGSLAGLQMPTQPDIEHPDLPTRFNGAEVVSQASGYILDIVVKCSGSPEDGNHSALQGMQMVIIGSNNEEDSGGSLERTSQTTWAYRGVIELYPDMGELTFAVQSEYGGDVGRLLLTEEEVEEYVRVPISTAMQDVEHWHKLVMKADIPALLLKFAISGMRPDEEAPVSLPLSEDNVFRLDGMVAMVSLFQEVGILAEACNAIGHSQEETLDLLGVGLMGRFMQTGNLADISNAIAYQQRAVALTPEGHADMPSRFNNLGTSFRSRFERTGDLNDIVKAIEYHQCAIGLTHDGHADMPSWLNNLGTSFLGRFWRTGNLTDISKAIEYQQKAVALTPEGHASMPDRLNNLGASFTSRSERTDNIDDVSKAIEYQQRAVLLTPEGHVDMPSRLNNLGDSLSHRFVRTGSLDDISKAIKYQQQAVALTSEGQADMPLWLNNVGISFLHRFERTGNLDDISKATGYLQRAVMLTPEGHADKPPRLNNLGASFLHRFERTDNLDDLSKATENQQRAVALTPEGHSDMPLWLNNVGSSFLRRFQRTDNPHDISKAIGYQQHAIALIPKGHASIPASLNNLGISFHCRFERTDDLDDISKAIEYQQHSIVLTPEGHADMPAWRLNSGSSLMKRFQQTSALEDCKAAVLNFHLATTQLSGPPSVRLYAARHWAVSAIKLGDLAQSLEAYTIGVELLSLVASLDQTIHNRHSNLIKIAKLTPEAVLTAILTEHTNTALEWLEQGRCLVWAQLNQLRTPVNELRACNATLANHFLMVSKALESSGSRPELPAAAEMTNTYQMKVEDQVRTHLKLAQEWNNTLTQIRHLPDFHDFLRPRKAATILSQVPPEGPIIIINVHVAQCDALALVHGADDVLHIPLDDITYDVVEVLRRDLCSYLASNGLLMRDDRAGRLSRNARNSSPLRRILRVLWKGAVKPILDALGYCSTPTHRNRIWWCPTGPLAFLPLHAAGIYGHEATAPGMRLSDYALSSYIPTVNTLLEKLRRPAKASDSDTEILLISQPNTPGHPPIPGTTAETQTILSTMSENAVRAIRLEGAEATTRRVEKELRSHQWVHFACHASQNPTNPLKSGFYLHDGQLELMGLIRKELPKAEFAFLSACQTSVGDEKLSDEAVHLSAGMLAAGYRGVVGTMWSIGDAYAPKIAEEFYGRLLKERKDSGSRGLNTSGAAHALDHAIRKIQNDLPDHDHSFLTWVPYAHYGL